MLRADNGIELTARVLQIDVRHVAFLCADDNELRIWRDAKLRLLIALQAVIPISLHQPLLSDVPDLDCRVSRCRHDALLIRRHPRAGDWLRMRIDKGKTEDSHASIEHFDRVLQASDDAGLILSQLEAI